MAPPAPLQREVGEWENWEQKENSVFEKGVPSYQIYFCPLSKGGIDYWERIESSMWAHNNSLQGYTVQRRTVNS